MTERSRPQPTHRAAPAPTLVVDGERYLVIPDVDQLPPFLVSLVSPSDHWLYVSSRGGLTAGRVSPDGALFPYVTDDQLHTSHAHTGPRTVVRVDTPAGPRVWEPFRHENDDPLVFRQLAKSEAGDQLLFEERHRGLGLAFRAKWSTSEAFGFVRTVTVENQGPSPVTFACVDGLVDLMPAGTPLALQQRASCLVNAYTVEDQVGQLRQHRDEQLLEEGRAALAQPTVTDSTRRALLDALQRAFEAYRARVWGPGRGAAVPVPMATARGLCRLALEYVEHSIRANRRDDGLYHSYNLLSLDDGQARVEPLYEMLEGQVAVLGSGLLSAAEAVALVDALFDSRLFRADQQSFLLYPERALPGFLEKNRVPPADVEASPLLAALLAHGDRRLVARDVRGEVRFVGHLQTVDDVRRTVLELAAEPRFEAAARVDGDAAVTAFERAFRLADFTGRSGTMYGYEGLGCIYWHMVSKLLLAVQEAHADAVRAGPAPQASALARAYERVRQGLGFNKSAREFGAFPTEPYSHTPRHAGAQQPGRPAR